MKILRIVAYIAVIAWLGVILGSLVVHSRPGHWVSSGDPEMDQWFHDQRIPGSRERCCDVADGRFVEEDIRNGHYWIRSEETKGQWVPVPDGAIINSSNKWGLPAVWWGGSDGTGELYIRCYAPGAKT